MERVLDQINVRPQWSKVTGKGVKLAVLDYAPGDKIFTPVNSLGFIHYHAYCCQYIAKKIAPDAEGFGINMLGKISEGKWEMQEALKWCLDNDIDVINMSLSAFRSQERIELIQRLIAKGAILCAAAGNDGRNSLDFPADQPGTISVGAYKASDGVYWGNSNYGPGIEIIAPTYVNIPHWEKGRPDINFDGTSGATPDISGVACLWKEAYPKGTAYDFIKFLKTWATAYGDPGKTGYGKFRFPESDQWIEEVISMSEAKTFIDSIKDYALANQKKVDVPAAIIIAQACLETGYGKYVCKDMDSGKDSRNLFNIKGTGLAGYVTVWTTEYYNGVATKIKAKFRAYNNYQESFEDHSRLMLTDRYKPCMAAKDDPEEFARQLQKCGYATDPKYADKLISIMKVYNLLSLVLEPEEEDEMARYERLKDIPSGFRVTIEKLMNAGIIAGDGSDPVGNDDVIDLSHDQVRSLVFEFRAGAFDRKLIAMGMDPVVKI